MSKVLQLCALAHPTNLICGNFATKSKFDGIYYAPARSGEFVVVVKENRVGIFNGKPRLFLKQKSLEHVPLYSQSESDSCLGDTIYKLVEKTPGLQL